MYAWSPWRPVYDGWRFHGMEEVVSSNLTSLDVKALRRYNGIMAQAKRATVYFEPSLHKALRLKAAHTDHSVSELVNAAVRRTLAEDAEDLATFERRGKL